MMRPGVVVVVCAALAGQAGADPVDTLSEAALRSQAGDHAGAVALYQRAYDASLDFELLVLIGNEQLLAGAPDQAVQFYCAYLAVEPHGTTAEAAADAVRHIQHLAPTRAACAPATPAPAPPSATPAIAPAQPAASISRREMLGIGSAAIGLVALGASVYYGHQASSVSDQITHHDPSTPWPDDIHGLEQRGQRYELDQKIAWGVAGVALVSAGVLYLTGRADRLEAEHLAVAPTVGHGGAGIAVAGGF